MADIEVFERVMVLIVLKRGFLEGTTCTVRKTVEVVHLVALIKRLVGGSVAMEPANCEHFEKPIVPTVTP